MSGKSRNRIVGSCNITDLSKNYSGMLSNEMPDDVMHKRRIRVISEEFTATSKKDFLMDSHLLETEKHLKAKVSFRKYCKTLLMDFLARVLSQVATVAQSWKKAMWKLLVFLICSGGFLYQTNEFLTFYWTFPTTTSLEESSPYEIITPAITFCSNNL
nr:uncharacterized protein LOC122272636 [Parasteatoda tepidariorum]